MNMTNEQKKLLANILEEKEFLDQLLEIARKKQAINLKISESIKVAGVTWSKFAEDSAGNAYMLADEGVDFVSFGENNDWRKSPIRRKLNKELYQKICEELGENALIKIQTNLFSLDGLRDYGSCEDMVSLLTFDLYRHYRNDIKRYEAWFWLCTPDSTPSGCNDHSSLYVDRDSTVCCFWYDQPRQVRPFFILNAECNIRLDWGI